MKQKIQFGIGLALTVPLNVAYLYTIQLLVGLDWHFLFYVVLFGLPLVIVSDFVERQLFDGAATEAVRYF